VLVVKNLLRRRLRTALSVLGVAIGIGAIIAFHAVGRGFRASLDRYMDETNAQLLVVNRAAFLPEYSRVGKEEQDWIRGLPEVVHLSRGTFTMAAPPTALKEKGTQRMLVVLGRDPGDRLLEKFRRGLQGRLFENDDEILLGRETAEALGVQPGGTLELFDRTFTVAGIHDSRVRFERQCVFATNAVVQRQMRMGDSISMGFVYLREGAELRQVQNRIGERYPRLEALPPDLFTTYYPLDYIDWFVWIVSLVSVVVGGLGVLNTMLMSVSERTREIGMLRAVGWSRGRVLRLILGEGVAISLAGGLAGLAAGALGAEALIRWAPGGLDTQYAPLLFVQALGVAVGLGLGGALYPAFRAGRLAPIEALRYE
jgi:putative ABC transport system permease protein